MTIDIQLLTNFAYGYPRGTTRRRRPYVLAVVHQTSNATANAQGERDYANRAASGGPSATYYIDRDGSVIQAVAAEYASWCSGDINQPDTSIPTVARIVVDRAAGFNANEAVWDQYEGCGTGDEPWTDAQFTIIAALIAERAKATGLPIDRTTVLAHRDINTIDRATDPWPADRREARMARLISLANANGYGPTPPDSSTEDTMPPLVLESLFGYSASIGGPTCPRQPVAIYALPSFTAPVLRTVAANEPYLGLVGWVQGDADPGNADSVKWLERVAGSGVREYVPQGDVVTLTPAVAPAPPVADCTASVNSALDTAAAAASSAVLTLKKGA